jgi:CheY-like chemotaxis protein
VELASALKPDLVILDVKMPVLDGISAAERIAAQQIAPVVILTAFSQRDDPVGMSRGPTPPGHPGTPPVKY